MGYHPPSIHPHADPIPLTRIGRSTTGGLATLALLTLAVACGSSANTDAIDRETFIDAYVDLRVAALDTDSGRVAASDRDAILGDLGIAEDDLLDFVEVHAADLEFMRDVWNDVELRMDRPRRPVDGR